LRLWLLEEPFPLVLGLQAAPRLRAGRHAACSRARLRRPARARGRAHTLTARALTGGETIVCDKGYAGREFADTVAGLGAIVLRPPRTTEPQTAVHLAPIRQRIESVFWTCKNLLTLERHGAHTPRNLFARIATRLLALAACISLNHQLRRPSRAIATYTA
jgi:hypothetical protein